MLSDILLSIFGLLGLIGVIAGIPALIICYLNKKWLFTPFPHKVYILGRRINNSPVFLEAIKGRHYEKNGVRQFEATWGVLKKKFRRTPIDSNYINADNSIVFYHDGVDLKPMALKFNTDNPSEMELLLKPAYDPSIKIKLMSQLEKAIAQKRNVFSSLDKIQELVTPVLAFLVIVLMMVLFFQNAVPSMAAAANMPTAQQDRMIGEIHNLGVMLNNSFRQPIIIQASPTPKPPGA